MRIFVIAVTYCCLSIVLFGCKGKQPEVDSSVNVISKMSDDAAKGDYLDGIVIGENYLRHKPDDANVLESTALLELAQAKQNQKDRAVLVSKAVSLLDRAAQYNRQQNAVINRFANQFAVARAFETAGDIHWINAPITNVPWH